MEEAPLPATEDAQTPGAQLWLFRGALSGNSAVFAFAAFANWVKKGSFLTAWAVSPLSSCRCSYSSGQGKAVSDHKLESGVGHC